MIVTVLRRGGIYTAAHVHRLALQARHAAPGEAFVCLADQDVPDVVTVRLAHAWPGWWAKLELFRPGLFPEGERLLYADLDTTLVGPLDDLLARREPFLAIADFYRHPPTVAQRGLGSGLMAWTAGTHTELYERFADQADTVMLSCGWAGDQRYLEGALEPGAVTFWQDVVPGQVVSYKQHCRSGVPSGARVVCFHGHPKPWAPTVTGIARAGAVCQ